MRILILILMLALSLQPLSAYPLIFGEIPLMSGLNLMDHLEGRPDEVDVQMIAAEATGDLTAADIYEFYEDHMQELGWQTVTGQRGVFEQGDKRLVIIARTRDDILSVTFKLTT